jgi:hypothetical protein
MRVVAEENVVAWSSVTFSLLSYSSDDPLTLNMMDVFEQWDRV